MSFGFSIGDFITFGQVIRDITKSLQDAGGAKSEYQELVRELETLQRVLHHLDALQQSGTSSTNLDSIKYAALSCRRPLEEFLAKTRKSGKTLDVWAKPTALKSAAEKLKWTFSKKEEIQKLQNYLNLHVGTINILLAEHGIEKLDLAAEKAQTDHLHIRERLDNTHGFLDRIKDSVKAQTLVVQSTHSMMTELFKMLSGEVVSSWQSMGEMVARVCISTQQIYSIVLEIKSSIATVDTRWTHFQAPLIVEDALGFKFPVPSEYDLNLLDTIIQHRFRDGQASREIQAGNYELFKTRNSREVLSANVRLLPGMEITMAVIVNRPALCDEVCPMPRCGSTRTSLAPGGGRTCCECNVWFSPSTKKRNTLEDLADMIDMMHSSKSKFTARSAPQDMKDGPTMKTHWWEDLKNVRWATEDEVDTAESSGMSGDGDASISAFPSFADTCNYMNQVKATYSHDPDVYHKFLVMLQDFNAEHVDIARVIEHIADIFSGKPELVAGFSAFLPQGQSYLEGRPTPQSHFRNRVQAFWPLQNLLNVKEMEESPILNDALSYLDLLKATYSKEPDVYNRFLDIMKDFNRGHIDTPGVMKRVSDLFIGESELVAGFNSFLPPGYRLKTIESTDGYRIMATSPLGTVVEIHKPAEYCANRTHKRKMSPLIDSLDEDSSSNTSITRSDKRLKSTT